MPTLAPLNRAVNYSIMESCSALICAYWISAEASQAMMMSSSKRHALCRAKTLTQNWSSIIITGSWRNWFSIEGALWRWSYWNHFGAGTIFRICSLHSSLQDKCKARDTQCSRQSWYHYVLPERWCFWLLHCRRLRWTAKNSTLSGNLSMNFES